MNKWLIWGGVALFVLYNPLNIGPLRRFSDAARRSMRSSEGSGYSDQMKDFQQELRDRASWTGNAKPLR